MKNMINISIHTRRILSKFCVLLISVISIDVQAQLYYQNFDSNIPMHQMRLQAIIINPDSNCWQVGQPLKTHFTYAPSAPNVIVTDNWDPYPIQTHSTFIVQYVDTATDDPYFANLWAYRWLQFLDMEDKKDFGMVHFSIDSGQTWENAFTSPEIYSFFGFNNQNVDTLPNGEVGFTGVDIIGRGIWLCFWRGLLPIDTLKHFKLRFTFISDSIDTGQDGWMMDNFELFPTIVHTLQKFEGQGKAMDVSPVPADDALYIKAPSIPVKRDIDLLIIRNIVGKEMFRGEYLPPYYRIITRDYPDGVYTVSMLSGAYQETKSITIQHQR